MSSIYEISTEKIRNTIKKDNIRIMEINIEYPVIENKENSAIIDKINRFYNNLSERFSGYCEKVSSAAWDSSINDNKFRPMGESMKFHVSYSDNQYISFVIDIIHFDGYFKSTKRLCQTWDIKDGVILPLRHFMKINGDTKKSIKEKVKSLIFESVAESCNNFSYTKASLEKYAGKINFNNYFLCTNGIAIWYDCNTLAPESEGYPTFIIPYKTNQSRPKDSSES